MVSFCVLYFTETFALFPVISFFLVCIHTFSFSWVTKRGPCYHLKTAASPVHRAGEHKRSPAAPVSAPPRTASQATAAWAVSLLCSVTSVGNTVAANTEQCEGGRRLEGLCPQPVCLLISCHWGLGPVRCHLWQETQQSEHPLQSQDEQPAAVWETDTKGRVRSLQATVPGSFCHVLGSACPSCKTDGSPRPVPPS